MISRDGRRVHAVQCTSTAVVGISGGGGGHIYMSGVNLKFTGLTHNLGQLEGFYREFQSNCWVNLQCCKLWVNPVNVTLLGERSGTGITGDDECAEYRTAEGAVSLTNRKMCEANF